MRPYRIIIVEDEFIAAESIAVDLRKSGYEIIGMVGTGEKAIAKSLQEKPDLILMDIILKGKIDGITASDRIHQVLDIPIVYLTSFSDLNTLNRAKNTHPKGYILKPYEPQILITTVANILENTQNPINLQLNKIQRKAKKGIHKLKQIAHKDLKLPSVNNYQREQKRAKFQKRIPALSNQNNSIVTNLFKEGIHITSLSEIGLSNSVEFLQNFQELLPELYTIDSKGNSAVGLSWSKKILHRKILFWGLAEQLLDILENYIELPLLYQGVDIRRDIANQPVSGAKQWHLDIDDDRMVKIIIYLNDVGINDGGFEYIPRKWTKYLTQTLNYKSGFLPDNTIKNTVPVSQWQNCTGASGTVIITDPCNIFHRAKPATGNKDRLSITFGYTSRIPKISLDYFKLSSQEWNSVKPMLSRRQLACLRKK